MRKLQARCPSCVVAQTCTPRVVCALEEVLLHYFGNELRDFESMPQAERKNHIIVSLEVLNDWLHECLGFPENW